jgi:hypothetical protein
LGCRKHVCTGETISITQDPWLPTTPNFKLREPDAVAGDIRVVADLIDDDTGWWNVEKVQGNFG